MKDGLGSFEAFDFGVLVCGMFVRGEAKSKLRCVKNRMCCREPLGLGLS